MAKRLRIGHGYDIHRLVKGRALVLGGVKIPYHKGLMGHSDADVLLHAIIDALVGAIGDGDIGQHFPSRHPAWRGASSLGLLRRVRNRVEEDGYAISNVDATILAEQPNLSPFKATMAQTIARELALPQHAVNIKAHTNEGLGPVGQGRAMAAHAVVLVQEVGR
ncbi:MAG: 2-C-methyl-D-erythritol 2,4-cyclodiphosphate synthase [Candidatus Omnitrophica bacterium]|nr:2-C-methyl-D-erythritol 2,4-cyclodiphosphate synthase [Candidatus Omnitrophota bacterium]